MESLFLFVDLAWMENATLLKVAIFSLTLTSVDVSFNKLIEYNAFESDLSVYP